MKTHWIGFFLCSLTLLASADEVNRYIRSQPYRSTSNQPYLVVFSGTPGSGKTTLALAMQHKYHAMRISSDEFRGRMGVGDVHDVCMNALDEIMKWEKNKLIILDMSIDRKYAAIKEWADKNRVPMFLIRMKLPESVARQRLIEREGNNAHNYFKHFDGWWKEYEKSASLPYDVEHDSWTSFKESEQRNVFRAFESKNSDAWFAARR